MSKETAFFFRQYDLAAFLISTFPCSCVFRTHHGYVPTGRHTLFSQAPLAAYIKYKKPKNIFSMLLGSLFSATFIFTLSIHFYAVKSSLWYLKRLDSKIYGAAENFSTSFFEIKPDCTWQNKQISNEYFSMTGWHRSFGRPWEIKAGLW